MSRYGFTTKVAGNTIASAHMNSVQTGVEAAVSGTGFFFTSGGAGNAYTGALTPAVDAYANARLVLMKANHTNTGAATLNLDSVGATAIKKTDGATDVASGDIVSGQTYLLSYNGTSWCLVGGGSAAAGVSGYLKVLQDIMTDLGAGDTNVEKHYSDGEYHGFLVSRTHATTATWNTSSATYTVPVGKKAVLMEIANSDGNILDSSNNKIRLRNVTDVSDILPESYFSSAIRMVGIREGSWGAAGKELQLQSYHGSVTVKPTGWVIFRVVTA